MSRVAVIGAFGFLGWHLRVLAAARGDIELFVVDRDDVDDPARLTAGIDGCDRVIHLAGVNRGSDADIADGNAHSASRLATALRACERPPAVAFANSTQCDNGTVYGTAKAKALELLNEAAAAVGSGVADVRLPNVFGEHGRPFYNSVVATFASQLASGDAPKVIEDRSLELLHARAAASCLLDAPLAASVSPEGRRLTVSSVLATLESFADTYGRGEIPDLHDDLQLDLFNTYRSFCSPRLPAGGLPSHGDERGRLVEAIKVHGGTGQAFFSTTCPAATRGQHYHLRKVERFVVLEGQAVISLRRKFHPEVHEYVVSGDEPVALDMPTMWVHKIVNTGSSPLLTLFWTNDLFNPAAPDTYAEAV